MRLKRWLRRRVEKLLDVGYNRKVKRCRRRNYTEWIKWTEEKRDMEETAEHDAADAAGSAEELVLLSFEAGDWAANARERMRRFFAENPGAVLAYGDEDVKDGGDGYRSPWLKPGWSPDSYLCRDYLGNAVAVRKELYDKLKPEERETPKRCHDRLTELAGGFERGCSSIAHVDGIIFHRESDWKKPTSEHTWTAKPGTETGSKAPVVSVIIPSKDNAAVLKRCLETLHRTVESVCYEILVVDNGSSEKARQEIAEELEKLNKDRSGGRGCLTDARYIYRPMEFNFSHMCNVGTQESAGELLLFLNDDTESVECGWMEKMAEIASRPWVGAVGYKLLYPDGKRIQHAGIVNVTAGPTHKLRYLDDGEYYDGRGTGVWDVLAVTGACLMLRRDVLAEAGGFCEQLRVAFNDVDLCFRLYELGYHNVVINTGHLLHHESLSRGFDETEEESRRLRGELSMLFDRHPQLKSRDPYYHVWLSGNVMDSNILPVVEKGAIVPDVRDYAPVIIPENARRDDCLALRVEAADGKKAQGYAMVQGSDNVCFTKQLLFQDQAAPEKIYGMHFTGQFRPDLETEMCGRDNAALCGFGVKFARPLPAGEYRIGALAKDKLSSTVLVNWSACTISV